MQKINARRQFVLDPSLELYVPLWKRDGAEFISDDKHGHLCTAIGALWTPSGRAFDGADDYLSVANTVNQILSLTAFSTVTWFKSASAAFSYFIGGGEAYYAQGFNTQYLGNGNVAFYTRTNPAGNDTLNSSASNLKNSGFHMLATVFDSALGSSNKKIYIDGNLDNSSNVSGTLVGYSIYGKPMLIGRRPAAPSDWFAGTLGELQIINRALTAPELRRI